MTVIEINDLTYRYGEGDTAFVALKNLSMKIEAGEFVAITGASGSGKSTLMALLGTLSLAKEGHFAIAGQEASKLGSDQLASLRNKTVGFVFQQFHLLPRLSILDNILAPLHYLQPRPDANERRHYERRAFELLERLGISDQAHKLPVHLSGGQKQRAAIARALLLDPAILLADEATGALDSQSSSDVMRIFAELNAEGRTVILITHDPDVSRAARRRIELKDGIIVSDHVQEGMKLDPSDQAPAPRNSDSNDFGESLRSRWPMLAPFRQAWQALTSAKLRTALTSLGLIIGVISITTMMTLGSAAQGVILKIFDRAGADRIYVGLDREALSKTTEVNWQGLHEKQDLPALQSTFAPYGRFSLIWRSITQEAVAGGKTNELEIETFKDLHSFIDQGLKLDKGRMLGPQELSQASPVALVGSEFGETMFPKQYSGRLTNPDFPLGETVSLRGRMQMAVTIVGVLKKKDVSFGQEGANSHAFLSLATVLHYASDKRSSWVSVVPNPGVSQRWLADSVVNYLRLKTGLKLPFKAAVPEEVIGQIMTFITIFQALVTLIGCLSILVGGIGIMNIMLVTIAERIKEIGLRKALGATDRDIIQQFLLECMLLCSISGLVGTFIGSVFCNLVAIVGHIAKPDLIVSQLLLDPLGIGLGLGTAIICGMTFGMMPALRASKLDPSEALRSE